MHIFFCDSCAVRITDADLRRGRGIRKSDTVLCEVCVGTGKGSVLLRQASQAAAADRSEAPVAATPPPPAKVSGDTSEDFPAAPAPLASLVSALTSLNSAQSEPTPDHDGDLDEEPPWDPVSGRHEAPAAAEDSDETPPHAIPLPPPAEVAESADNVASAGPIGTKRAESTPVISDPIVVPVQADSVSAPEAASGKASQAAQPQLLPSEPAPSLCKEQASAPAVIAQQPEPVQPLPPEPAVPSSIKAEAPALAATAQQQPGPASEVPPHSEVPVAPSSTDKRAVPESGKPEADAASKPEEGMVIHDDADLMDEQGSVHTMVMDGKEASKDPTSDQSPEPARAAAPSTIKRRMGKFGGSSKVKPKTEPALRVPSSRQKSYDSRKVAASSRNRAMAEDEADGEEGGKPSSRTSTRKRGKYFTQQQLVLFIGLLVIAVGLILAMVIISVVNRRPPPEEIVVNPTTDFRSLIDQANGLIREGLNGDDLAKLRLAKEAIQRAQKKVYEYQDSAQKQGLKEDEIDRAVKAAGFNDMQMQIKTVNDRIIILEGRQKGAGH